MRVTYSFLESDGTICKIALIQLKLIKDITNKLIEVTDDLLDRCFVVKSNLIKFPEDTIKVESLYKLRFEPWLYEPLKGTNYKGISSVRLSKETDLTIGDRLVFEECPKFSSYEFVIMENLFHYLRDINRTDLKGTDLELYDLFITAYKAPNANKIVEELYDLSLEKGESKIWTLIKYVNNHM